MDNNDKFEALTNMAAELNASLAADILDVPIVEHFKIQKTFHPNIIFAAVSDDDYIEQFVFDSVLPESVDIEEKIKQVVADTVEEMKKNELEYPNDNLYFYKLHKSVFDYRVYIQNFIKEVDDSVILIKQFNVYFIEPESRNFYQLSLSSCPVDFQTVDQKELENQLYSVLVKIMDGIKYIENE